MKVNSQIGESVTSDVKRALTGLRRELDRDLAEVRGLAGVEERWHDFEALLSDLDGQLERVRSAAVITLVGSTGAGKSTLLNALVGKPIAIEGESRPTTRAPVIYRPRDADVTALLAGLPGEAPVIVDYDPSGGGPWQEQILIDAPDTNSVVTLHREVVGMLASRSDVLIIVAHRQSISELSSVEFVDAFAGRRGMIFLLSRADELADEARDQLLAQMRELATERWKAPDAPVLAISAREAQTLPNSPGWAELCGELHGLMRAGILGRVRRHNAIGTAVRLVDLAQEIRGQAASELAELDEALSEGLNAWRDKVNREVGERLELHRSSIRELLWNETARRWDGPGGWALRVGGIGTVGIVGGALMARANPLLAAGAAAGAVAASKAHEVMRRRKLNDTSVLLPAAGELEAWYRADLGKARLIAARVGDSPTALGVPDAAGLGDEVALSISEAWSQLVERELPAAAEGSARWYVRWPVDLPIYGFGAYILWVVAKEFWDGDADYIGMDFLVGALLMLLAWLFVGRVFVRMILKSKSRELLGTAQGAVGEALSRMSESQLAAARQEIAAKSTALDRLVATETRWRGRIEG